MKPFINSLKEYPRELKGFVTYVKELNQTDCLMNLDMRGSLGFYIDYLFKNNIVLVVNANAYRLYFKQSKIVKRKSFKDVSIIDIYKCGITDAFSYLENPF